jgi:hypothetical protein
MRAACNDREVMTCLVNYAVRLADLRPNKFSQLHKIFMFLEAILIGNRTGVTIRNSRREVTHNIALFTSDTIAILNS